MEFNPLFSMGIVTSRWLTVPVETVKDVRPRGRGIVIHRTVIQQQPDPRPWIISSNKTVLMHPETLRKLQQELQGR